MNVHINIHAKLHINEYLYKCSSRCSYEDLLKCSRSSFNVYI